MYKINNVCGAGKLFACGVSSKIAKLGAEGEINFSTKIGELNPHLKEGLKREGESGGAEDRKVAGFERGVVNLLMSL